MHVCVCLCVCAHLSACMFCSVYSQSPISANWIMHHSEFNIRCHTQVNWSYQSSKTFLCARICELFLKGKIACGNYNYYFLIFPVWSHADISAVSWMQGLIVILAFEGAGQVHTANDSVQYKVTVASFVWHTKYTNYFKLNSYQV